MGRLIAAAVLAAVTSAGVAADPAYVAFQKAEDAAAADRPAEAEPLYREAIRTGDAYIRRRAYLRLTGEYVRTGRQDHAIRLGREFRDWLKSGRDREGEAELDTLLGDCYTTLGHLGTAAERFDAALAPDTGLSIEGRLRALRGAAGVADARKDDATAARRWDELAKAARAAAAMGEAAGVLKLQIVAGSHLAAALHRQKDTAAALAALEPLPALHDKLKDPLGRRDTQRQRANLLAASDRYADAAALYAEALRLHREHRPKRRLPAADILAEWTAAAAAKKLPAAVDLRAEAGKAYAAVLHAPDPADLADGGPLAAFVKLQLLNREARNFDQALTLARDFRERWEAEPLLELRLKADRGGLELLDSAYRDARDLLTTTLADLDRADTLDLRALPQVLVQLATAELAGALPEKGGPLLDRCACLYDCHTLPTDPVRAECEYLRGVAAAGLGDLKAAVAFYRRALELCDAVGATAEPVRFNVLLSRALVHKDQLDTAAALLDLEEATRVLAGFAEPDDRNVGLIGAARIDLHLTRAEVAQAVALLPGVLPACVKHGLDRGFVGGTVRHAEALGHFTSSDPKRAEEANRIWTRLEQAQRGEESVLRARTLNHLGLEAERRGDAAAAREWYRQADEFEKARPSVPAVTRAITLWRLAVAHDAAGQPAEAKRRLDEVFQVADKARFRTFGGLDPRARFYAQFRPAFEQLAQWHVRDGDGDALVGVLARTRSRTLLDQTTAANVDPRDALTGPDGDRLRAKEAAARQAVSRLRAKLLLVPPADAAAPATTELVMQLHKAQDDFATVWHEIAKDDPVASVLTEPAGADRRWLPAGLGAKTAVIVYFVGPHESAAVLYPHPAARPELFRLTLPQRLAAAVRAPKPLPPGGCLPGDRRGLDVVEVEPQPGRPATDDGPAVPLTDAVAGPLVAQYLRQVPSRRFAPTRGITIATPDGAPAVVAPAELLGDALLPQALRERLRGAARVVVIPDGPLHRLPLECLPLSTPAGTRYALDELPPVAYAPSLGLLAAAINRPAPTGPATLLTVGDPAYPDVCHLPRLEGSGDESTRVKACFPAERVTSLVRERATERNVADGMRGKRFVHLAAHGFADERFKGLFAAVALAAPPGGAADDDGLLHLHEVHRLGLAGCELTVLSACVTHVGPQEPMEAGVTLAGAFLCAGSRRVAATCWSVDDAATAELVGEFFRGVVPGSVPYADALKAARLRVRSRPGWEAPYFWAGFVFVGPPE